jgi:hypothetical protein
MNKEEKENVIEIAQAILLSAVVVATAWCSYQAGLWSGIQTFKIAASDSVDRSASEQALLADSARTVDSIMVMDFAGAVIEQKPEVADFYLQHVRPELGDLLKAWLATKPLENPDAPPHPFAMPQYTERIAFSYESEAEKLRKEAKLKLEGAYEAKHTSDDYVFKTVLLASVLFLGGILSKIRSQKIRLLLLALAYAVALVTFGFLLTMPLAKV